MQLFVKTCFRIHTKQIRFDADRDSEGVSVNCEKTEAAVFRTRFIRAQNLSTVLEGRIDGKRNRGRPRRRWLDDIKDWTGRPLAECTAMARDRDQWRMTVEYPWSPTLRRGLGKARQ